MDGSLWPYVYVGLRECPRPIREFYTLNLYGRQYESQPFHARPIREIETSKLYCRQGSGLDLLAGTTARYMAVSFMHTQRSPGKGLSRAIQPRTNVITITLAYVVNRSCSCRFASLRRALWSTELYWIRNTRGSTARVTGRRDTARVLAARDSSSDSHAPVQYDRSGWFTVTT